MTYIWLISLWDPQAGAKSHAVSGIPGGQEDVEGISVKWT